MKVSVDGIGAWGPGFENWAALSELLTGGRADPPSTMAEPKPALIPARERRRAPLLVRLAVEVASQACEEAGIDSAAAACVCASGMGDMAITDYMCRTLAGGSQLLSPTRFHNSVHNAAAGYWSISTGCHEATTSVSGFHLTASAALLEAAVQCTVEERAVLLVAFDVPGPAPIDEMCPMSDSFGAALMLRPGTGRRTLELAVQPGTGTWPELPSPHLRELYDSNPAARMLAVLDRLSDGDSGFCALPLGRGTSLCVAPRNEVRAA